MYEWPAWECHDQYATACYEETIFSSAPACLFARRSDCPEPNLKVREGGLRSTDNDWSKHFWPRSLYKICLLQWHGAEMEIKRGRLAIQKNRAVKDKLWMCSSCAKLIVLCQTDYRSMPNWLIRQYHSKIAKTVKCNIKTEKRKFNEIVIKLIRHTVLFKDCQDRCNIKMNVRRLSEVVTGLESYV